MGKQVVFDRKEHMKTHKKGGYPHMNLDDFFKKIDDALAWYNPELWKETNIIVSENNLPPLDLL